MLRRVSTRKLTPWLALVSVGCTNQVGSPEELDFDVNPPVVDAVCESGFERIPQKRLRRLTATELQNTLREAYGDSTVSQVSVPDLGDAVPTIGLNNDPNILNINAVNIDVLYGMSESLAAVAVTDSPLIEGCVSSGSGECLPGLVASLGRQLWRRPLSDEEVADVMVGVNNVAAAGGTLAEQADFVVQALTLSPNTLYRTELGSGSDPRAPLDGFELASALSYGLWDGPPDETLMGLADSGSLGDPVVLEEQARRMIADPRFARTMSGFFTDLLKLEALYYKEKAESLGLTEAVRRDLVASAQIDLEALYSDGGASLFAPFVGQEFSVNERIAPFFGVDGISGNELVTATLPPEQRHGVLTHPAVLATHAGVEASGIVKRGVYTLEQLLCVKIPAPPADIAPAEELPPDFDPETASTRERLEIEHSGQAQCRSCHQAIDPAGFGFENYDAAGRYRTVERETIPIDASGTLEVKGETLRFEDGVDYVQSLASSTAFKECVTERFVSYVVGERPGSCEVQQLSQEVNPVSEPVDDLLVALITSPLFRERQSRGEEQ